MRLPATFRRSFLSLGLLAAMVAALVAGAPTAAATAPTPLGPRHYYLSLGDSFGFGLQVTRLVAMLDAGTYTPDAFNTGYADDLAARIRARLRPHLQVVNYSCPLTATGDMLRADGCLFQQIGLALHDEFSGAQLDAATAFLRVHPGRVSPITISIGTVDMASAIEDCNAAPVCVRRSGVFRTLRQNLTVILGRLRAAAPTADILLLLPHNVTVVDFPGDNPLWAAFVLELRAIAAAHEVRVADAFAAITLSGRTCELTFACLPGDLADSHPELVKAAQQALQLHPSSILPGPDGSEAVKKILGGVSSIAVGVAELRNRGYGSGHGQASTPTGLSPRHAHLAVNAAITWCHLLLDTLADATAPWRRQVPGPLE